MAYSVVSKEVQQGLNDYKGENFHKVTLESSYIYNDFVKQTAGSSFGCLKQRKIQTSAANVFFNSQ